MRSLHAVRRPLLVALAVVAVGLLAASCSDAGKLDTSKAETKIPVELRKQFPGTKVGKTACKPDKVKRAAGVTFTCSTSLDGQPATASVVEEDTHGNVTFVLDKVPVSATKTAKDLASKFGKAAAENGGAPSKPVRAACPGKATRLLNVYETFRCTLTADGQSSPYSIVVCDTKPRLLYVPQATVPNPAQTCKAGSSQSATEGSTPSTSPESLPGD